MYKTRISSDYFTEKGLENRTGIPKYHWELVIIKEIIDNALDAIESNSDKKIIIRYSMTERTLYFYDNGKGLSISDIQDIYDFDNYVSRNRHIINASRGKQGNGLKCVIGLCQLCGYDLFWHTNENTIINFRLDIENAQDDKIGVELIKLNKETQNKGIEIRNIKINSENIYAIISQYAECNNDVLFIFNDEVFKPTTQSIDRQAETSIMFYGFDQYKRLLNVQNPNTFYKDFLEYTFGTRVKKASRITGRIKDLEMTDVQSDFNELQNLQNKKPLTILKKHLIGYKNIIEQYPYVIEFETIETENTEPNNLVMINNSITYRGDNGVGFEFGHYQVTTAKKVFANNLQTILESFKGFEFRVHIITPCPEFNDYGKTRIDISDISHLLVDTIRKTINKEKREARSNRTEKPKTKKELALENMNEAFHLASTGGKYSITARQMYYKLRELVGSDEWETDSTYSSFTQEWLTQWLDENQQYESKVNFSDRGNFIVDGMSKGVGSINVRNFITDNNSKENIATINADIIMGCEYDFDVCYKYDKVLYIEKTGFNDIFIAEDIQDKYNLLIVSGQGYASRSAKQLLYDLQQKGLKIYCMHDLDVAGMTIIDSLGKGNEKFKYDLDVIDLGITPQDVSRYNIVPEKTKAVDDNILSKFSPEHQEFFSAVDGYTQRVELNAFTTEQLLQIIDDKLKGENGLPMLNINDVIKTKEQKLKEFALFQLVSEKYQKMFRDISIGDIADILPSNEITFNELQKKMPEIENKIIIGLMEQFRKVI